MKILNRKNLRFGGLVIAFALLGGCATQNTPTHTGYYYFPPPPDEPRLQYLTSFSSQKELYGGEQNSFLNYVTGKRVPDNGLGKPYGAVASGHKLFICDTELNAVVIADFAKRHLSM